MSSKSHEYRIIVEEGSGQTSGNSSNTASRWQSLDRGFDDNRLNEVVEESERLDRWRLVCLTIGIGGLQVVWTAIMSQGSPFLSSIGLPSYITSLIWLSGPLSGAFVQPLVGFWSDNSTNRWGRRRPFILSGTIITVISMLLLPWTPDLVDIAFGPNQTDAQHEAAFVTKGILATLLIFTLNISLQPIQSGLRSLVVDVAPPCQQVQASSYASIIVGIGSIFGYCVGIIDMPTVFPFLGDTNFKALCAIASICLTGTVCLTCVVIKEKQNLRRDDGVDGLQHSAENDDDGEDIETQKGRPIIRAVKEALGTARALPKKIKQVCVVQMFAWMSWFPFLYYVTTYIASLYERESIHQQPLTADPKTTLSHPATSLQYGTMSLLLFAIVSLVANLTLPYIINTSSTPDRLGSTSFTNSTHSNQLRRNHFLASLRIKSLTLPRAWALSHLLRTVILLTTAATTSRMISTWLIGVLGLSWALTQWAPFALIAAEMTQSEYIIIEDTEMEGGPGPTIEEAKESESNSEEMMLPVGTILGIHNVAIASPQIAAAVLCSSLFWIFGRFGLHGGDAIGWVIRIGGLAGLGAAWVSLQIRV